MRASSSTTSTVGRIFFNRSRLPRAAASPASSSRNIRCWLILYGEFEDKSTAVRRTIVNADEAMMVADDRRDDRQTKAGAAAFGREVRLKNPRAQARFDPHAVVGDFERHNPARDFETRGDADA